MMKNVSIRLNESVIKDASKLAELELVDKSVIIREALEKGIVDIKLETAIDLFSKEKVSTGEAAEIAGLSIGEMMNELVKRGLRPDIRIEDVKNNLKKAMKIIK